MTALENILEGLQLAQIGTASRWYHRLKAVVQKCT